MAEVVFGHFGASAVALVLRFQSRPTLLCLGRCCACARRCCRGAFRCCCRGRRRHARELEKSELEELADAGVAEASSVDGFPFLKWYWFHLAMQVGFIVREHLLISSMDGWCLEVTSAHVAYWTTLVVVAREVWNFSKVRLGSVGQKVAVDGLLDMLLLPVNISFFCALCVRVLKLQPESHIGSMVAVVIESPDIYEAYALWSVLELFVKVVQHEACKGDADTQRSFESFENISIQGVKMWMMIQSAGVAFRLVLQGVIQVYVPTLCYWMSKSCKTCSQWYEEQAEAAMTACTFILCSFAIMFVFYFETGFRHYLKQVEPMWKFLGVKGIVSVTYFQWLVISMLEKPLDWNSTDVYLMHCLLYGFWMPIIAVVHTLLAYPYALAPADAEGTASSRMRRLCNVWALFCCNAYSNDEEALAPWLTCWLRTLSDEETEALLPGRSPNLRREDLELAALGAPFGQGPAGDESAGPSPLAAAAASAPAADDDPKARRSSSLRSASSAPEAPPTSTEADAEASRPEVSEARESSARCGWKIHAAYAVLCSYLSVRAVLWLVPLDLPMPGMDGEVSVVRHNITCTSHGDLAHFVESRAALHFAVLNDTAPRWSTPGVAGVWLPLCASTHVGCQLGHYPKADLPSVTCNANGEYSWQGECHAIACGHPPVLPHATPRISDVRLQKWTYGVEVSYDCEKPGFRGAMSATCNIFGHWVVNGACEEVHCGPPPMDVAHASPLLDPRHPGVNISMGMVVRYQCDEMYNGTPTAICGDDGLYLVSGRCRRECAGIPDVLHAVPSYRNEAALSGWTEGMRVPYTCDHGFTGFVTAVCKPTGEFTVAGMCDNSASISAAYQVQVLGTIFGVENFVLLGALAAWSWKVRARRFRSSELPPLLKHPELSGLPASDAALASPRRRGGVTPPIVQGRPSDDGAGVEVSDALRGV